MRRAQVAALVWPEAAAHHAHAGLRQAHLSLHKEAFGDRIGSDRTRV